MAGFMPGEDDGTGAVNPFLPSKLQTLGMMLSGLGSGISAASSRNLPAYFGIAPGAQAFENSYGNLLARGANYDLANKNYQLNASYKNMAEKKLGLEASQLEMDQALQKKLMGLPGFNVPTSTSMGPNSDYYTTVANGGGGLPGESGGNYGAVNPSSGATGKFQFMPDTWASVAQAHPDLQLPFNMKQATPQQQEAAMRALTGDNAKGLEASGVPATPGTLYLAHRFGVQGAKTFLSAPDNAQIAQIFPAQWIQQNPDLQGTTVGQFKASVGQRFGGNGPSQMPGAPPSTAPYLPLLMSPRLAPLAKGMMENAQNQYKYGWDVYNANQKNQQQNAENVNRDVVIDPITGLPKVNETVVGAKKAISAVQGTDTEGKMLLGDYEDARKANSGMQESASQARTGLMQVNRLSSLLDQVTTGKFKGTTTDIKAIAKSIGIDLGALGVTDDVGPAQAADALSKQLALTMRNPSQGAGMPGSLSNSDRDFLNKMIPGLDTTPEGRKLMVEYARKMYQRGIDQARIANEFMRSPEAKKDPLKLYTKLQEYADANPIFTDDDAKEAAKAAAARPPLDSFQPKMQSNGFATNPNPNAPTNMSPRPPLDSFGGR